MAAAIWGFHWGMRRPGAARWHVVLTAGIASAAVVTVWVVLEAGAVGAEEGAVVLVVGYWSVGYAFALGRGCGAGVGGAGGGVVDEA
ncbi:MAG: hypothetical protein IPF47_22990 [Gemmatimonadetes bacterium]|nr:hypothetical protein [Gemmatimonadota bacterium]